MYKQKINYVIIGFFVTAMLSAGVGSIALLAGRTGPADHYFIVLDNVADVKFGTQVRYEGYPIGQVEDITPEVEGAGMQFRVEISIQPGWRVPSDSIARIGGSSFLAAKTIDIDSGDSQVAVALGERIASRARQVLLNEVILPYDRLLGQRKTRDSLLGFRAAAAGRESLLVIHGVGTGALRDAVRRHLRESPYVAEFEVGSATDSGDGSTTAKLS